jgi:hypothetical protein
VLACIRESARWTERTFGGSPCTSGPAAALAGPSEVLVSATVKDLVAGSDLEFQPGGSHVLKGLEGSWSVFGAM